MQRGIDDYAVMAIGIGDVIGDQHFLPVEQARECQRVGRAERQSETDVIARDLPVIMRPKRSGCWLRMTAAIFAISR